MTERWWSEADTARPVLDVVGGPDVAQSISTAVLGSHALLADSIRPLAKRTLVDVDQVSKAMETADLGPVVKALANAVEPVMGDAAVPYAAALAQDIHTRASSGTEHALKAQTICEAVAKTNAQAKVLGNRRIIHDRAVEGSARVVINGAVKRVLDIRARIPTVFGVRRGASSRESGRGSRAQQSFLHT